MSHSWIKAADEWWAQEHDLDSADGVQSLYALVERVRLDAIQACAKDVESMPLCTVRCAQKCAAWIRSEPPPLEACEPFVAGAQAAREMLARFVEQGGDSSIAASIRANWSPAWGRDPGRPT